MTEQTMDAVVEKAEHGSRLDVFLSRRLSITRSAAARLIDQGRALVDGKGGKPSFKLKEGMKVHARALPEGADAVLTGIDVPLDILYEDTSIVVLNKPAGLVVHPGAGSCGVTLVHALLHRYPEIVSAGPPDRPGIVHRLDKLTSGVMVAARTAEAYERLAAAFKAHLHARDYQAICYGRLPERSGRIETLMRRSLKDRTKMSSKVSEGRQAVTDWLVLKEWREMSLLKLSLETGRTHQIRVHLADMGHPVAGDPEYGGRKRANTIADLVVRSRVKALRRQMLHAWRLGIFHPATGEWIEFSSEPPEDFMQLSALLDEREGRA